VHAVVNLDKPRGITSQEAVTRAKRVLGAGKAGHAGSLDPIATGVLLVCLGEATKISRFLMDLPKEYLAVMKFGERTDTLDADGAVVERDENFSFGKREVERALGRFRGKIRQRPPMYSALKVSGSPLYKLARKGVEVERPEREVEVYSLELESLSLPFMTFRAACSRGTYIRTLVDDIGRALGTVAHMTELRRLGVGRFRADDAATFDELPGKESAFHTVDGALSHLGEVVLSGRDCSSALHGRAVKKKDYGPLEEGICLRLKSPEGELFAMGVVGGDQIKVGRVLHISSAKS